jgi:sulfatase maturation enzyme AslB (radical SAM superfamily)
MILHFMPLKIFLDSRDWITLAKIVDNKEKNSELLKVYEKIKKLSNSGHAMFPFSVNHLDDIMKRSNKESRDKVIDVMIDISKGWVMKPYRLFFEKEIENAVLNRLGKDSIHDIASQIFGKGIAYTAGEEYFFSSTTPEGKKFLDEHGAELRRHLDSIDSMPTSLNYSF